MKWRKTLGITLALVTLVAADVLPTGMRLPWQTGQELIRRFQIRVNVTIDSTWADSTFFGRGREADSTYTLFFSIAAGDTAFLTRIVARDGHLTLRADSTTVGWLLADSVRLQRVQGLGGILRIADSLVFENPALIFLGDADADSVPVTAYLAGVIRDTANAALALAVQADDTARVALDTVRLARDTANVALALAVQASDTAGLALSTARLARDTANVALAGLGSVFTFGRETDSTQSLFAGAATFVTLVLGDGGVTLAKAAVSGDTLFFIIGTDSFPIAKLIGE